jgi:hypothetical protein
VQAQPQTIQLQEEFGVAHGQDIRTAHQYHIDRGQSGLMVAETFPHQAPNTVTLMRSPQGFFGNSHTQTRKANGVGSSASIQTRGVQAFAMLKNPLEINPTG